MAKQLFKTSEKSNFILNMTQESYSKLASWGLITACLFTSFATMIPVFSREKVYSATSLGLTLSGVICMILALIGIMKKYVTKRLSVAFTGSVITLVWAIISFAAAEDKYVALNGYIGRGEGLLAILFYICFFVTAASMTGNKARKTLIYGILVNGIINSIIGLIQVFTGKFSDFIWASTQLKINAASGVSQSPLFLAMVLSISIASALMGLVIFEGKAQKIFCIICACVFSFTIMFTYSFIGICGAALAIIFAVIVIFAAKAPKIKLLSLLTVIIPAIAAVVIVQAGAVGNIDSYRLYDGRILWFADSYNRLNSSGNYDADNIDIDDTYDVYYTLNRKTMDIISSHALVGTGPDHLVYPQMYIYEVEGVEDMTMEDLVILNKGTFDRVYNEYLYTAATRGIPSAIALVMTILGALFVGFSGYKKKKDTLTLCMTLLTLMGALIFLIGCTNTAFSPIFWALAGSTAMINKE